MTEHLQYNVIVIEIIDFLPV